MITKEQVLKTKIISNIKIIKKLSKFFIKICTALDLDYNVFLEVIGLKQNEDFSKEYLDKVKVWNTLSVEDKEIVVSFFDIDITQKRNIIRDKIGIITDEAIDTEVKKYNEIANYFESLDFGKLEELSVLLKKREDKYNLQNIISKISSLLLDQYDEEKDEYGELYKELCNILHLASNKEFKEEELLETSIELLIELLIRIVLKTNNEIEESFFIKKLVNLLTKSTNIQDIIKKET